MNKVPICSRCGVSLYVKPYTKIRFKGVPVFVCKKCGRIISLEIERIENEVVSK